MPLCVLVLVVEHNVYSTLYILYCVSSIITADGSYQEGSIRLIGGSHNWEGRVEIYISRVWGAVGSNPWTTANAEVVCRQLGHSTSGE